MSVVCAAEGGVRCCCGGIFELSGMSMPTLLRTFSDLSGVDHG